MISQTKLENFIKKLPYLEAQFLINCLLFLIIDLFSNISLVNNIKLNYFFRYNFILYSWVGR